MPNRPLIEISLSDSVPLRALLAGLISDDSSVQKANENALHGLIWEYGLSLSKRIAKEIESNG